MDLNLNIDADDEMFDMMKLLQLLAIYSTLPENVLVKLNNAPFCHFRLPHRALVGQIN
jgi:hypothetical protein